MWKHRLKLALRDLYARTLYHTGLHRVVDRLMPPRLTILAGHCVTHASNAHLPPDMVVAPERMREMLTWFSRRYRLVTVSEGWERVRTGKVRGGSLALSMDDGYKDNALAMQPLLAEQRWPATVYVETDVLDERRVNWSHKYFWCVAQRSEEAFARAYAEGCREPEVRASLESALEDGSRLGYRVKRVLKYDADPADRARVTDDIFRAWGGQESALCESLFMTWDDVAALAAAGLEIGAHTRSHPVLSRLGADEQRAEIGGSAESIERTLGRRPRSFAYPFGRRWDVDPHSSVAAGEARFETAVSSHSGTNEAGADVHALKRVCIDNDFRMHLLATEVCGGFELLRRLGLDWSE